MRIRQTMTALSLTAALAAPGLVITAAGAAEAASGCYITASAVNLRSKPKSNSTAVGVAYKGNKCTEKGYDYRGGYGWFKIKMKNGNAKGKTGWVREDLVHTPSEDVHTCIPEDDACHNR